MNTNEDRFEITDKGLALMAYLDAQEQAADEGVTEGFEEALGTFERDIYIPIKKHVTTELILGLTEGILAEVCEDPEVPAFDELDDVAFAIGAGVLHAYGAIIAQREAQDA